MCRVANENSRLKRFTYTTGCALCAAKEFFNINRAFSEFREK
jgi:hypothetical protein